MTQETKKVSRRQAIKLLTATAGAATMASLPNKWVKPVLKAGVLPAHAQTSPIATNTPVPATATPTYSINTCAAYVEEMDGPLPYPWDTLVTYASISPVTAGINMRRTIYVNNAAHPSYTTPFETTGTTDGTGTWSPADFDLTQLHSQSPGIWGEFVIVRWEIVAPDVGTGTCENNVEIVSPQ